MTYTCPKVTLNGIDFDDTADSDGIIWSWTSLDGWWDSPDVRLETSEFHPDGLSYTVGRHNGRAIVLSGYAAIPEGSPALWFTAARTLAAACNIVRTAAVLYVDEPIPTRASVRRSTRYRVRRVGELRGMEFDVPLLAADPRKYSQTLHSNIDASLTGAGLGPDDATIVNAGTDDTWPTLTIDGPATNPRVRNVTDNSKYVQWIGTLGAGDTIVFNLRNRSLELNGVDDISNLDTGSTWWRLKPGSNTVRYTRTVGGGDSTCTVEWRDAY